MRYLKLFLGITSLAVLLFVSVGCERKVVIENGDDGQLTANSCFTCHGEDGYLLAAKGEWENSIHASGNNVDYTNRGGGYDCTKCHDHQGFVEYLETGSLSAPYDQVSSIHCFTCHSPHERGNLTLRTSASVTLKNGDTFNHGNGNLCANCHQSRENVETYVKADMKLSSRFGPHHGPQADLLNGSIAYVFEGESYENTDHGSKGNNEGCVRCHMGNPQTHIGYRIGGHSFNMEDEEDGSTLVGVCAAEACHGEAATSFDYDNIQTDVEYLLDILRTQLFDEGIIKSDGGIDTVVVADINIAGALWNYVTVLEDRSYGVHNPDYIRDMLEASIEYMQSLKTMTSPDNNPEPMASH